MADIFREVEEEVRRERYQKLWKKYGNLIVGVAALAVVAVAGYQLYQRWDLSQREEASRQLQAAAQLAGSNRFAEADAAFKKLADEGPRGYAILAQFQRAALATVAGKRDQGIAIYRDLIRLEDRNLASVARVRLAWAQAETDTRDAVAQTLRPLTGANNPWRFAANEILAFVDLRLGRRDEALRAYEQLAADTKAPNGIRDRSRAMAEFIRANPSATSVAPPRP
ncbi:MAG: tetratricopeptide repeat protein [Alphaproteobacteria bacterium]